MMLTQITSPPHFISPEEHDQITSSTPSSFTDIPPVLRFQDAEVDVVLIPSNGWGWDGKVKGQLWVTEAAVAFLPPSGPGFSLPFPSLTLHALTPSTSDGPAHIYCQIDASDEGEAAVAPQSNETTTNGNGLNGHAEDEEEGEGEDEFTPMRELRIYISEAKLQPLFEALSQCSALHESLLPNGEPSSFFGFGDMGDGPDDEWEDDEPGEEEAGDEDGEAGRALTQAGSTSDIQRAGKDEGGDEEVVDQMERFLNLVDWGSVEKPAGWDSEGAHGEFDDADE